MKKYAALASLSVFLVAAAAVYYLAFYLPSQGRAELLFSKKQRCEELGKDYRVWEEENQNFSLGGSSVSLGVGRYSYSEKLDTCLYVNEKYMTTAEASRTEYYVVDLYTNAKLANYLRWDPGCEGCEDSLAANDEQYRRIVEGIF